MPGRPAARARSCLGSPRSAHRRGHATTVLRGDALGPVRKEDHQSFRVRADGSSLPLPPVLDPLVVAQRSRWTQQKAQPDVASFTPFQKQLWANPYAHALASPVRNDRSLGTLLPSALLVTLHLKPHPTTADPWLLPLSLSAPNSPKHLGPPLRLLAHRHNAAHLTAKKENVKRALSARHAALLGSSGMRQLVWRQDMPALLLSLLRTRVEDKLSWYFARQGRLVPVASPAPADIDAVDDAACVLFYGSLRTRADDVHDRANAIVAEADKWALYFRAHFGSYFDAHATPPPNLPKATHHPPNWFEPVVPRLAPRAQFPPLAFPTARWRGRKVALYSLSDMLGAERAAALVSGTPCEEERCWVLRRGRQNVGVEMVLGLLQGYLVEPGAVWEGR